MIQTIYPESESHWLELRQADITSTAISALFGANPYLSRRELWEQKKNNYRVEITPNEKMKWGNALQDSIATTVAKEEGWEVRKMTEYIRDNVLRLGASFDFAIGNDGIQEIKTVGEESFKRYWTEDEAPVNYEFQVQLQLMLSGRKYAYLCALIGGQKLVKYYREPNPKVFEAIKREAASFWHSVESGTPPPFEFPKDNDLVSALYKYAEPGSVMDGNTEIDALVKKYKAASESAKTFMEERDRLKSELLVKIGQAEKVKGGAYTISAGMVGPTTVSYERQGYRNFRVTYRGEI